MATPYVMPKLAMAMNEGTISEWLVSHGDKVEKGQPLASVETEKVAYDVESPESGYFCIILQQGETVPCEDLVGYFCETPEEVAEMLSSASEGVPAGDDSAADSESAAVTTAPADNAQKAVPAVPALAEGARLIASPLAKKMAKDAGLDLRLVAGTGPGTRIVKRDVLDALERGLQHAPAPGAAAQLGGSRELARIPLTGMRKTIAERMTQSLQTTAQLSSGWESDITDLLAARGKFVARAEQLGTKVSVNAFIIKAIAYGIGQVPIANSCQDGNDIVIYDNINMGIAISMPGTTEYDSGLMVAVLRNVERMGVVEIDREMKALINRVRNGEASADDLSGATITLSSTAGIAPPGMTTTPVLNLPNAALIGPSTPVDKPVIHKGEIAIRTMMPVSFTFDHRLLDGEPAARFMKALHEALENPELMLA
ncbi:MAG: dihydrolipoamide acetyltransferase family protein [Halioglobus sp.]